MVGVGPSIATRCRHTVMTPVFEARRCTVVCSLEGRRPGARGTLTNSVADNSRRQASADTRLSSITRDRTEVGIRFGEEFLY